MTAVQIETEQAEEAAPTAEEASSNVYWTFGAKEVFNLQTTFRGALTVGQIQQHLESVKMGLIGIVAVGGHAKAVGKQPDPTPNAVAPVPPTNGAAIPPGVPVPPAAPAGAVHNASRSESPCAMIEVATSYQGGKTQLKFHVNGMEHPLTFTKEVPEMARLLAPLGFTAAHIVVGQKYPVNCIVTWQQAEKYRNVLGVRPA